MHSDFPVRLCSALHARQACHYHRLVVLDGAFPWDAGLTITRPNPDRKACAGTVCAFLRHRFRCKTRWARAAHVAARPCLVFKPAWRARVAEGGSAVSGIGMIAWVALLTAAYASRGSPSPSARNFPSLTVLRSQRAAFCAALPCVQKRHRRLAFALSCGWYKPIGHVLHLLSERNWPASHKRHEIRPGDVKTKPPEL